MIKKAFYTSLVLAATIWSAVWLADRSSPESQASAQIAARAMASYLENAPAGVTRKLAGRSVQNREPFGAVPRAEAVRAEAVMDATQSGITRIEALEQELSARYSDTVAGSQIRRFVALRLAGVDTDFRSDLNAIRLLNDLMQNPPAAMQELQASYELTPADALSERSALLEVVLHLGVHPEALPRATQLLTTEIQSTGASPTELSQAQARLEGLVDAYTRLVSDKNQQIEFIKAGIEAQSDARLRDLLKARLESVSLAEI